VGLGTDNVEVRPKCVFASMLERCIAEFGLFCRFRYLSEQKAAKLKQWSALPPAANTHRRRLIVSRGKRVAGQRRTCHGTPGSAPSRAGRNWIVKISSGCGPATGRRRAQRSECGDAVAGSVPTQGAEESNLGAQVLRRFSKSMKGKPSRPGRPRSFGMSRRACLHSGDRVLTFPRPRENSARFAICN